MRYSGILLALTLAACSTTDQQGAQLLALTDTHFRDTTTIKDGPLDVVATFSTVNGFQEKHGLLGIVWNDEFLRAFVDKKTGTIKFQLYAIIPYTDSTWRFYNGATYLTPNGPVAANVDVIDRDVDCTGSSTFGGCSYTEQVAFDVPADVIQRLADAYGTDAAHHIWLFKFSAHSGSEYSDGIIPAEAKGLLEAMQVHGINTAAVAGNSHDAVPTATSTPSGSPPAHPAIGVTAIPTPLPVANMLKVNGGLMVITVTPGSPADHAGLKPGDVITKYADQSVNAVADLQSAVNATSSGSTVQLSVQRGNAASKISVKY